MMKNLFSIMAMLLVSVLLSVSCSTEDAAEASPTYDPVQRTVLVYIAGDEIDINRCLREDVAEMCRGSRNVSSDCRVLVFVDYYNQCPYIAEIKDGKERRLREYDKEVYSCSTETMRDALQWMIDASPANEYGLVIEGHGTGALVTTDTLVTDFKAMRAYGMDVAGSNGNAVRWMNIGQLTEVLERLHDADGSALHLDYLFFDACCMQTVEVAYNLRHVADYLIAPASEVPLCGAPYEQVLPLLARENKANMGRAVIDAYFGYTKWSGENGNGACLSVVRTDGMEELASATAEAMRKLYDDGASGQPLAFNKAKVPYYFRINGDVVLHDILGLMQKNLEAADFAKWKMAYDNTVMYKRYTADTKLGDKYWNTAADINFNMFALNDETCGCLSMYLMDKELNARQKVMNANMQKLPWAQAVGWKNFGW